MVLVNKCSAVVKLLNFVQNTGTIQTLKIAHPKPRNPQKTSWFKSVLTCLTEAMTAESAMTEMGAVKTSVSTVSSSWIANIPDSAIEDRVTAEETTNIEFPTHEC